MRRLTVAVMVLAFIAVSVHFAFAQEFAYKDDPVVDYHGYKASATTVIVSFTPTLALSRVAQKVKNEGFAIESMSTFDGIAYHPAEIVPIKGYRAADLSHSVVRFEEGLDLDEVLNYLRRLPFVTEAYPNYVHELLWTPNDQYYNTYQGNFKQIYMPDAWAISTGSGVKVAVIDTGYRTTGMTDKPVNLLAGYDFRGDDTNTNDYIGHGTHVSNTIAEHTNNTTGLAGIAYNATIMPLKVFPDYNGGAYEADIIDAINYASSNGAKVINMSLGGGGYVSQTNTAINNAYNNNVLPFAASGNSGLGTVEYPAAYANCVAVGSVKRHSVGANPVRSSFSNYGTALDIVAPGETIYQQTFSGNTVGYYAYSGTSMATPHAAAVAALLVAHAGAHPAQIRNAMLSTAHNPAGPGVRTNALGYGEVDATKALNAY
jgi:serine protease